MENLKIAQVRNQLFSSDVSNQIAISTLTCLLTKYSIPRAIWKDQEIKSQVEILRPKTQLSAGGWFWYNGCVGGWYRFAEATGGSSEHEYDKVLFFITFSSCLDA